MTNCTCPHRFGAPYHDDECPAVKQRSYTTATHAMTTDHEPACNCNVSIGLTTNHYKNCPAHPANAAPEVGTIDSEVQTFVSLTLKNNELHAQLAEAKRERDELRAQLSETETARDGYEKDNIDLRAQLTAANLQISVMGQNYEAELQAMRDKLGATTTYENARNSRSA